MDLKEDSIQIYHNFKYIIKHYQQQKYYKILTLTNQDMDYRLYAILTVLETERINFEQVKETSLTTTRKSIDGLLTFIEFDCNDIAEFLQSIEVLKIVNYDELITLLETIEWKQPIIKII